MFRQEEKFFLNYSDLINTLKYFNAYKTFPNRKVNSIYFDTKDLDFFNEGEDGIIPRIKCRYRWYGNPKKIQENGSIEVKTTHSHFKEKETILKKKYFDSKNFFKEKFNLSLSPICQISYDRVYYINKDQFRFTYDYNIRFKIIGSKIFNKFHQNIFEIKYESKKK